MHLFSRFAAVMSFTLFVAAAPSYSVAQVGGFCLGGDLNHLSTAQRQSCAAALDQVRSAALALHTPQGWHFVVVCGEEGWKQYASFTSDPSLLAASAHTDPVTHETFLRERDLAGRESVAVAEVLTNQFIAMQSRSAVPTSMHTLSAALTPSSQTNRSF